MSVRHRDNCPLDCKVYVGELGNSGTRHEIEEAFGYYGPLRNVWVARNPPGFAFVMFEDPRDARDAVRALDGKVVCGRRIKAELSTGRQRRLAAAAAAAGGGPPHGRPGYIPRESRYPSNRAGPDYDGGRPSHHRDNYYRGGTSPPPLPHNDHYSSKSYVPRSRSNRSRSFSPIAPPTKYGTSNGNGISSKHVHRTPPSRSRSRSPLPKSPIRASESRYH